MLWHQLFHTYCWPCVVWALLFYSCCHPWRFSLHFTGRRHSSFIPSLTLLFSFFYHSVIILHSCLFCPSFMLQRGSSWCVYNPHIKGATSREDIPVLSEVGGRYSAFFVCSSGRSSCFLLTLRLLLHLAFLHAGVLSALMGWFSVLPIAQGGLFVTFFFSFHLVRVVTSLKSNFAFLMGFSYSHDSCTLCCKPVL